MIVRLKSACIFILSNKSCTQSCNAIFNGCDDLSTIFLTDNKIYPAQYRIEDQLTCGICLDLYTNPQSLPCLHSFCQRCVERLPVTPRGDKDLITCPTCRTTAVSPKTTGGGGFPVAFHLNNLKEVYDLMKEASNQEDVTCEVCNTSNINGYCKDCSQFLCLSCDQMHKKFRSNANHKFLTLKDLASSASQIVQEKEETTMNCPKHDDSLRVFCETCEELICRDCTIGDHKNHDCTPIRDSFDKHCQILKNTLNAVEKMKKDMMIKITDLTDRESEIKEQGELVKQEIDVLEEEMIDAIRQSTRNLKGEVDSVTDSKLQVVTSQKKSAERSCGRLEECSGYVKQSLEMDTHQQVLSSKKPMMERMNGVMEEINVEDYTPIEKSDVRFIKNKKIELPHIGNISYTTSGLHQCKVKKINSHQVTLEKNSFSFPLLIESPNSSLVTVPLSSLSCSVISSTPINTTVTTTDHPGVYRIHCTPVIRGSHQVKIRVNGIQLESVSVVVPFNPYINTITPIRTIKGLALSFGVAVSNNGHVVVSGNRVTVLDKEGKKIKSFSTSGDINFSRPRGIAITPDNFILVTNNHKIQKISMDGKLIASVGQQGSKPLEFIFPWGITISPTTGQVYAADRDNHRIQVLNPDLSFSFSFGCKGSAEGQFQYPTFITIDNQGIVYVSDHNHHIQKFTSDGKFLSTFGKEGYGPGQLNCPAGIALVNNLLYVVEVGNHRVSVFSTDGKFIRCFGSHGTNKDQFRYPRGITIDNEGCLYICDYDNNRLVVY